MRLLVSLLLTSLAVFAQREFSADVRIALDPTQFNLQALRACFQTSNLSQSIAVASRTKALKFAANFS